MININWFPIHMANAIKQINKQNKFIDLIIEIIDSRIPFSSSNPLIDNLCKLKPKLIILNKKDLTDPNSIKSWIAYYEQQKINFLTLDSKHENNTKIIISKIFNILNPKIKQYKNKGIKHPKIKILVVGIPNVGKSTFINSLIKQNSALVGNSPGITKNQQLLKLNNQIYFVDTPGILFPKIDNYQVALNLAFTHSIKENILPKEEICLSAIKWMCKNYFSLLKKRYNIKIKNNFVIVNDIYTYKLLLLMQKKRFNKIDKYNIDNIIMDFLNNLWNNKFGLISFEFPHEIKKIYN